MPLGQFDERVIYSWSNHLDDTAVVGTFTDLQASADKDTRHDVIQLTNTDSIAHNVAITVMGATENNVVGEVNLPAGSGVGTVPPVDALAVLFPSAFHYWLQASGSSMSWTVRETINTGKRIVATGIAGAF